jgi:hypothetical protein
VGYRCLYIVEAQVGWVSVGRRQQGGGGEWLMFASQGALDLLGGHVKAHVLGTFGVYTGGSIAYRLHKWYNERSYSMSSVVLKPKATH